MAVITISRQSGSEGNEIARILCEKLGYRLFDKNMMIEMAKELGAESADATNSAEESNKAKALVERILNPFQPARDPQHKPHKEISFEEGSTMTESQVRALVLAAHAHGKVIIIGRGSQVILAEKPDVLHVRVVAPLEVRIKNWQARENLSYQDASKRVSERDKAHIDFVKTFFDEDIREPSLYDLLVNTSKFPPDAAADLIMEALLHIEPPH